MRYLYADSEPFPYGFDFLATLEGFLRCAGRCLGAVGGIEDIERSLREQDEATQRSLEAVETFATDVGGQIGRAAGRAGGDEAVQALAERLRNSVADAVRDSQGELRRLAEQRNAEGQREIESLRSRIREAAADLFLRHEVPVERSRFRVQLEEGEYRMLAVCTLPAGVEVDYRLDAGREREWARPRRISDLVDGQMELQVGMKKKFLRRDLTREIVRVDELVVAAAELEGDHAQVHLRKKATDETDHMLLFLHREDGHLLCEIHRTPERQGSSTFSAVPEDLDKLERLWNLLESDAERVLPHRRDVASVRLDGDDIAEDDRARQFVERWVELLAPTVDEIARRSPSDKELSLKVETDGGKREELYRHKEDLAEIVGDIDDRWLDPLTQLDVFPEMEVEVE